MKNSSTKPCFLLLQTLAILIMLSPIANAQESALEEALRLARSRMISNAAWEDLYPDGFVWEFDAVPMVLVPAGCFQMGNDPDALYGDRTTTAVISVPDGGEQCFDEPFWIDQTEVTERDFLRLGGIRAYTEDLSGDERPIGSIHWLEALDYCETIREGSLPTEREWEYAARGPDALYFPWGNDWNENNVVLPNSRGANVGSIPAGASWVGAFDLAGNVLEYTRSQYSPYPYDTNDGRDDNWTEWNTDDELMAVLRGGAWSYFDNSSLRSATRSAVYIDFPYYRNMPWGFRCVRSATQD